jgi:hypothetical protein
MMNHSKRMATTAMMLALLAVPGAFAAGKAQTLTGKVSDAMCGAKHAMAGSEAECTRSCIGKGSKYALVVGDKVYTLDTTDKAALATLDKQAGASVSVQGTVDGDTIHGNVVSNGGGSGSTGPPTAGSWDRSCAMPRR